MGHQYYFPLIAPIASLLMSCRWDDFYDYSQRFHWRASVDAPMWSFFHFTNFIMAPIIVAFRQWRSRLLDFHYNIILAPAPFHYYSRDYGSYLLLERTPFDYYKMKSLNMNFRSYFFSFRFDFVELLLSNRNSSVTADKLSSHFAGLGPLMKHVMRDDVRAKATGLSIISLKIEPACWRRSAFIIRRRDGDRQYRLISHAYRWGLFTHISCTLILRTAWQWPMLYAPRLISHDFMAARRE